MTRNFFWLKLSVFGLAAVSAVSVASVALAAECTIVPDPTGDVMVHAMASSTAPTGFNGPDITSASFSSSTDGWLFSVTTTAPIIAQKGQTANVDLMIDADGDPANNDPSHTDTRSGSDTFFIVSSNASTTAPWKVKELQYDPKTHKWVRVSFSVSRFFAQAGNVHFTIGASDIPKASHLRWHAVVNVGVAGGWFTEDEAPAVSHDPADCGYISTIDRGLALTSHSTSTLPSSSSSGWLPYVLVGLGLAAMAIGVAKGKG